MPKSFDVSITSPVTVEQVQAAFAEEDYWQARFAAFDTSTTLDALNLDPDGAICVSTTQDLRRDGLPRLVAKFYPGDLKILSTETWTPIGGRRVRGEISISVAGAPGSGSGAAMLAPQGIGSQLTLSGTVEFKVPLVGGTIESYLGNQFAKQIPQIQRFTTSWIGIAHDK